MDSQIRASDPPPKAQRLSIRHAKESCFRGMDDCLVQQNPKFAAKVQTLEQMLQLWAKHSGVDARKGMSLDDRLKDHLDLKATLIGLLELIEQKMAQALSSPDDDDNYDPENDHAATSKDDDDVDPEEFLIQQKWRSYSGNPWQTVGASVDMLIELTALIRKSTVRNASLPTHLHRSDYYFAEYAKLLARNWFKDARRSLADQLGDSVFVRRNHMLYKMKHEEKISYSGSDLTPLPSESTPDPLPTRETTQRMRPLQETTPRIGSPNPATPIFANPTPSSTNLSQFDRNKFKQRNRKIGALSGITEGSVSVEETSFSYMYPEPPALGEKQRYGVCPYCSVLLSASKLTKGAWRQHLHEDIQPYVCLSEKCQHPAQFFSNSTQWLQHMDKFHGRDWPRRVHMATWYCDREHDRLEFKSESELKKHLNHDHTSLSEAHVNALVRRNWGVGRREPHICPLCESTPSNIVPLMNDKDKALLLCRHIGDHLKALALFSLPSLNADPANEEQNSSSRAQPSTNDASNSDPRKKEQEVAQFDGDLEGSLTFEDDPYSVNEIISPEATISEEHITNVPPDLDATLEWEFTSLEQEAPELDPILRDWKMGQNKIQQATFPMRRVRRVSLIDQIFAMTVQSVFDELERAFFPNGSIDKLVTKESVVKILRARGEAAAESLTEFILHSAKKLFVILIYMGNTGYKLQRKMRFFRDEKVTDLSLPLHRSWWQENKRYEASGGRESSIDDRNYETSDSSEDDEVLSSVEFDQFCNNQYKALAPVFSNTRLSYDFAPSTILPFTKRQAEFHGPSGRITRYEIHKRHINEQAMDADRPYYVDVKEVGYDSQIRSSWEHQVKMLSYANSLGHEHIVRFLAAFRRGLDEYFMFESATGGNLRDLWHKFRRRKLTSGLVKVAFHQMIGLASAIHKAHHPSQPLPYRHGDLCPANIFWFNNGDVNKFGTLKIGGWGFEEEVKSTARPWVDEFEREYGTGRHRRYEAPELGQFPEERSCQSDIWSIGCVMLEFLIWLMYGVDGLEKFIQAQQPSFVFLESSFYQEAQDDIPVATVDPVVLEWMDHMAADPACEIGTTALGKLLDLIRTRLLVVELPQRAGLAPGTESRQVPAKPHSSVADQSHQMWERCTSTELEKRLREISDENETERYWLAAEPKPPPKF